MKSHADYTKLDHYVDIGRIELAKKELSVALESHPDDKKLILRLAKIQKLEEKYQEALESVQDYLTTCPDDNEAIILRADLYLSLNAYSNAEKDLIYLIKEQPSFGPLYSQYGFLMLETGHISKARQLATEGLRLNPQDQYCQWAFCFISLMTGNTNDAEPYVRELMQSDPDCVGNLILLVADLLNKSKFEDAEEISKLLVQHDPNNPDILELAKIVKLASHWSMKIFYPLQKFGWLGAIGLWFTLMILLHTLPKMMDNSIPIVIAIAVIYFIYCILSWIWPRILKRVLRL